MIHQIDDDGCIKLKTILIGNSGVGKTNLINIAQNIAFNSSQTSTVNCSFFKTLMIVDNIKYNVYLWDTIGQEKLKSLTKIFFKNSKIVILVYDITNKNSFDQLSFWLAQVKESLGNQIILGVLGNKKDLFAKEEVSEEEAMKYAQSIGARWALTSAKTDRESFLTFIEDLIKDYSKLMNDGDKTEDKKKEEENTKKHIALNQEETKEKKEKKKKICFFF